MSNRYMTFASGQNAALVLGIINESYSDQHQQYWVPEPEKSPGRDFYFFPMPAGEFMQGLGHLSETFTLQPFNPDWRKRET